MLTINTDQVVEYRQQTRLDGALYTFDFRYNDRESFWYLDLSDENETPIRTGIKLVEGSPLLRLVKGAIRPAGELSVLDTTGAGREADFDLIGEDLLLIYLEAFEV